MKKQVCKAFDTSEKIFDDVKNAAFALNSDGGFITGTMKNPGSIQTPISRKSLFLFALTAENKGGHSSIPREIMLFMIWLMQ